MGAHEGLPRNEWHRSDGQRSSLHPTLVRGSPSPTDSSILPPAQIPKPKGRERRSTLGPEVEQRSPAKPWGAQACPKCAEMLIGGRCPSETLQVQFLSWATSTLDSPGATSTRCLPASLRWKVLSLPEAAGGRGNWEVLSWLSHPGGHCQ